MNATLIQRQTEEIRDELNEILGDLYQLRNRLASTSSAASHLAGALKTCTITPDDPDAIPPDDPSESTRQRRYSLHIAARADANGAYCPLWEAIRTTVESCPVCLPHGQDNR